MAHLCATFVHHIYVTLNYWCTFPLAFDRLHDDIMFCCAGFILEVIKDIAYANSKQTCSIADKIMDTGYILRFYFQLT